MAKGWIAIHRKFMDSSIYRDSQAVHLWLHLLLRANHQGKKVLQGLKVYNVERGQILTGRKALSNETGINESKIQRLLKLFEKCHMIEQQTNNANRLLSILNYDQYQESEQQVNSKRTASEQQVNTNNNDNNDNNDNKRNKIEINLPDFVDVELWDDFMVVRKKLKAQNTQRAINSLIKIINDNKEQANAMIEKSVVNSWKSLFPDKNFNQDNNKTVDHGIDTSKAWLTEQDIEEMMNDQN